MQDLIKEVDTVELKKAMGGKVIVKEYDMD